MDLPRLQLFEFNDHPGAPRALKDTVIESLSHALEWGRMLEGVVAPLTAFLAECGATEVLDLGAGAGGPAKVLVRELLRAGHVPPRLVLTDLLPQPEAWAALKALHPGVIDFVDAPVDATHPPAELARGRARVVINTLHHFPPAIAQALLRDAVEAGAPVFIAEGLTRNPFRFASFAPAGLTALLLNPLLSPRDRLWKALLTWATPVAILVSIWDGSVSAMRTYTEADLRRMVEPFGAAYRWTYVTYRAPLLGRGSCFYGVPPTQP
jgi:hypothetical protein